MNDPTAEDIKRLIEDAYPGYRLKAELEVEVHDGTIKTYRGFLPPDIEAAIDAAKADAK